MKIAFWGTRGSLAKPGPTTARYGGNTSCVEIRSNSGALIVVDCGTGCHNLGQRLLADKSGKAGHLLISHTHWDHIQGMPFFAPLFVPGNEWSIYGPRGLSHGLRTTLAGQMEHTYFPITLEQFGATIRYHDLVEGTFNIDDVKITTHYLNHPALTLGYRFEADGATVVYSCDHEPHASERASGELPITGTDGRHAGFLAGADLVIHDAQYTASEYASKIGWGHSTVEYAVRVCRDAGVKRLALTHHDPLRDDAAIDRIVEEARHSLRAAGSVMEVLGAAEGVVLEAAGGVRPFRGTKADRFPAKAAIADSSLTSPVLLHLADGRLTALLTEAVTMEGLPYRVMAGREELLRAVAKEPPSLVLVEHNPPVIDAHAVARAVRAGGGADAKRIPVVIVTAEERSPVEHDGLSTDTLTAPFSVSYARTKIRAWALRTACRWLKAEMADGEEQRVAALHGLAILDTPPEERFDRLTRIASAALGVPTALVSFVDHDRQWFKSNIGLEVHETTRDLSFCAHAVQHGEELIVPDTLLDDRFADSPIVQGEPRIRFYAGAPLILDDGSCVGTFCVIDSRPRSLSEGDLATLRDLRDLALEELNRRPA